MRQSRGVRVALRYKILKEFDEISYLVPLVWDIKPWDASLMFRIFGSASLLLVALVSGATAVFAVKKTGEVRAGEVLPSRTYQRRVLIMDFHSPQAKKNLEYLQVSIPEAFIGPLQKANTFELQSRDLATEYSKLRPDKSQALSDAEAIQLGKATSSEVVLTGNYVLTGDELVIQAKAIDVMSGRVSVSESIKTRVNNSLFDKINALAQKMSDAMAKELPPLTERRLQSVMANPAIPEPHSQAASQFTHTFFISFGLPFNTNLYTSNQTIAIPEKIPLSKFSGFSLGLSYWNQGLLPFGLMAGAEFSYNSTNGTANVIGSGDVLLKTNEAFGLRMLQTELLVGNSLMRFIPWKLAYFDFVAIGGVGAGHLNLTDTASQSVMSGIYGVVPVGFMSIYELGQVQMAFGYRSGLILLPDSHLHLGHRIDAKVGYRL